MAKKKKAGRKPTPGRKPKFAPIHGSRFTQKEANYICPILLREHAARNGLTPEDLLAIVESKRHPLHKFYNWNDTDAAQRYRLIQAGQMLRSFEVVYYVSHSGEQPVEHRTKLLHYVRQEGDDDDDIAPEENDGTSRIKSSTKPSGRNCYVTTLEVMSSPKYQKQLIERAKQELQSYRNRYARIQELLNFRSEFGRVFDAICRFIDRAMEG